MKSRVLGLSLATFLAMTAAASAGMVQADQGAANSAEISNTGVVTSAGVVGNGSSLGVSATGAAAQASVANIGQGGISLDTVVGRQDARNTGSVTNVGAISGGAIVGSGVSLTTSAVGSVASAGVTTLGGVGTGFVGVEQKSFNDGTVFNSGTIVGAGMIGNASSMGVTAVGAIAQASVSNIDSTRGISNANVGPSFVSATQSVQNTAAVTNVGSISSGINSGNGQGLSVSAVGAAASISISNVR